MRSALTLALSILLTTAFTPAFAAPTMAELTVAVDIAQAQYDSAVEVLGGMRFIDAQADIAVQQIAVDKALAEITAGTATTTTQSELAAAATALAAAQAIVAPALARAETARTRLEEAGVSLADAGGTITAVPAPTDLSEVNAKLDLLAMQVNALAAADVTLATRASNLEAQANASTVLWAQLCGRLKVSYTANCAAVAAAAP